MKKNRHADADEGKKKVHRLAIKKRDEEVIIGIREYQNQQVRRRFDDKALKEYQ